VICLDWGGGGGSTTRGESLNVDGGGDIVGVGIRAPSENCAGAEGISRAWVGVEDLNDVGGGVDEDGAAKDGPNTLSNAF
jgi:hypothetical protein